MSGIIKLGKKVNYEYPKSIKEVDDMTGIEFERFVFNYLRDYCEYDGNLSEKNDYGIDIILWTRDDKTVRYGVQCKRYGPKTILGENDLMKMQKGVSHYGITYNSVSKPNLILFTNIPEKQVSGRGLEYILNEQIETYYREDCINIIRDLDERLSRPKNEANYRNIAFDSSKTKYESFKENSKLVDMLKKERKNIARFNKISPVYLVFNDKTIIDIISKKPKTIAELTKVFGLDKKKVDLFGKYLLDKILDFYKKDENVKDSKKTESKISKASDNLDIKPESNTNKKDNNNIDDLTVFLKETRKKISSYNNITPLYMVFNNKTLENIIKMKPKTIEELKKIYGINSKGVDIWGTYLLNEMKKYLNK